MSRSQTEGAKTTPQTFFHKDDDQVRVIVELSGTSGAQALASKGATLKSADADQVEAMDQAVRVDRDKVVAAAQGKGINLDVRHSYALTLRGFSANVRYGDIASLKAIPGVRRVTVAKQFLTDDNYADAVIGAPNLWSRQTAIDGTGELISIIDTGIDYRHSELGKQTAPDPDGKVIGGHNWADNDDEIIPFASTHGVHVAGIAAATGDGAEHVKGVAPRAQLLAEKVFSNNADTGSAWTDDLVAAIEDSVNPNSPYHKGRIANVLNMSLGATSGFVSEDDPEQVAVRDAVRAGAVVSISAGNSYFNQYGAGVSDGANPLALYRNQDLQAAGSPGTTLEAITVASSLNTFTTVSGNQLLTKVNGAAYDSTGKTIVYYEGSGPVGAFSTMGGSYWTLAIPTSTAAKSEEGCNLSDWNGVDLSGKVALIKRGSCNFSLKIDNAAAAGAAGAVIWNQKPDPDITVMAADTAPIPAVMVMNSFGSDLFNQIKTNGANVQVAFNGAHTAVQIADPKGDTMSDFSSWGTTPELKLKPDVTAPGQNIYSTVVNDQYEPMNGTSMAAPHVAGASALVMQAHPDYSPADVKAALMNTAVPLKPSPTANPYSPRKQGAGRIQVDKAVDTKVLVTGVDGYPSLSLGEVGNDAVPFSLKLTNLGATDATFDLTGAVYRPSVDYSIWSKLNSTLLSGASVTFEAPTVTVPANDAITVNGTLDLTNAVKPSAAAYGYFAEGFITLAADAATSANNQPNLGIPFMSYVGKWSGPSAPPVIDPLWDDPSGLTGATGAWVLTPFYEYELGWDLAGPADGSYDSNTIAINNVDPWSFQSTVWPSLALLRNARQLTMDVVDGNGARVERIASEEWMRNMAVFQSSGYNGYLGYWNWDGKKYNAAQGSRTPVAEGQYYIRVKSLTPGANTTTGWQTYDIPVKVDNSWPEFNGEALPTGSDAQGVTYQLNWDGIVDQGVAPSGLFANFVVLDNQIVHVMDPTVTGTYDVKVPYGDHANLLICSQDNAGNASCAGTWNSFTVGEQPHIAAVGPTDILTNNARVTLNYTMDDQVKLVTYSVGPVAPAPAPMGDNGLPSGQIELNLGGKDGMFPVTLTAYADVQGTQSLSQITFNVDLDMSPPAFDVAFPGPMRPVVDSRTFTVEGTVFEAHAKADGLTYSLDEGLHFNPLTVGEGGNFSFPVNFTTDGRKNIIFHGEDAAGNKVNVSRTFIVDATAPSLTTALDPETGVMPAVINVVTTNPGAFDLTGTAADGTTSYSFFVNDQPQFSVDSDLVDVSVAKDWTYAVAAGAGPVLVKLQVVDRAGNLTTRNVNFTPAGQSPVVAVNPGAYGTGETRYVTGTVAANVTAVTVNGIEATVSNGTFSAPVPSTTTNVTVLAKTTSAATYGLDFAALENPSVKITAPAAGAFLKGTVTVTGFAGTDTGKVTVGTQEATVSETGTFSADVTDLVDGPQTITVTAGTASASVSFVYDTTAPVFDQITVPDKTVRGDVPVSGKVTDANLASLTVNGTSVVVADDGTFTTAVSFAKSGKNTVTLVATDKAGNQTKETRDVTIGVIKSISVTPHEWSPALHSNINVTYEIGAQASVLVGVYQNNVLKRTLVNGTKAAGTYSVTWDGTVSGKVVSGAYEVRITSGTESLSDNLTIKAAASPVTLTTGPASLTNNPVLTFAGTAQGNAQVVVTVTGPSAVTVGPATVAEDGSFSVTADLTGKKDGTYTFSFVGVDSVGNRSTAKTARVTLDTTAPTTPVVTGVPAVTKANFTAAFKTTGATQLVVSQTSGPTEIADKLFTMKSTSVSMPFAVTSLAEGVYAFDVAAFDAAGNQSGVASFTFTVDRSAPTFEYVDPDEILTVLSNGNATATALHGSTFSFGFMVDDANLKSVTYKFNGLTAVTVTPDEDGLYTITRTLKTVKGANTFVVTLTDKAGNTKSFTVTVTGN